ncbi:anthranilate synthase component I family protein [Nesterenkonia muleiensis]|uniref:anthranilate synthase component I family protein n=1 Tax=Nesterenkonia muleiensis TaxID=2282648 RepID=UPI0013007743|nr:anthranilate synthase component I family protein [Nesterenkonia muleiensis]
MVESVVRTVVPFSAEEDAAAQLFGVLLEVLGDAVPAAFLDSSDHGSTPRPARSRYSILAFSRGAEAQAVRLDSGAFGWLAEHWPHRGAAESDDGSEAEGSRGPFQLGWVGWIGYENQGRLFAATHAVVIDHQRCTAEIQSQGQDPGWVAVVTEAVTSTPASKLPQAQLQDLAVRDPREHYLAKIRAAQAHIREGNSYEVCLTTAVTGGLTGDPWAAYQRLRRRNRAPFTQFFRFPAGQHEAATAVLSTSPERFASISADGLIRSEPIKGTRPRGATPQLDAGQQKDLRSHPKDRAENVMIADLVRNDLSIHAVPGTLRTERLCVVETYPSVHQMVSTISAQLEPEALRARALSDAFPPGSMTGAPKISTMNILAGLESAPRGPYSGAAGWFSATGACDLSVLIRTAVLTQRESESWSFHLGVGGAITADSVPEAEWEEVVTKSQGVLRALGADFPQS